MKNTLKRMISVLLCLGMILSVLPFSVFAEEDYSGELLQNPGFENTGNYAIGSTTSTMEGGWKVSGGGYQKNNPHSGSYGFYLNGNINYYVYQEVTVPYTGLYNTSAYIHQGGSGAKLGLRMADGTVLQENVLASGCNYSSAQTLTPVLLTQGDVVQIYCKGSSSWTNGDDFSFTYDFSNVTQNLLEGMDLSDTVSVRAPWAGPYILTATVEADETDAVVTLGDQTHTVAAGTTEEVKLTTAELALDTMMDISIGGTVSDASLIFDVSTIPNEAPVASDVTISGVLFSDEMIVGGYTFSDPDEGQKEGTSTYRWLVSDSADGEYTAIEGAVAASLTLDDNYEGKYLKFEVTPVDSYGKAGEPSVSEAAGPAHINYVRNAGMELESAGSSIGWGGSNGGSIPNKQSNSYDSRSGFKFGQIPANDADAVVYYGLTVSLTGKFTLQAYVQTWAEAGTLGIRLAGSSSAIADVQLPNTNGEYQLVTLSDVAIERDTEVEVYVKGASGCSVINADDFALFFQGLDDMPNFTTLKSFEVEKQVVVNKDVDEQTIEITVPYGTDLTALEVTAVVSDGAAITPASGTKLDFSEPVIFTITNGDAESVWTVTVKEGNKVVRMTSDNETLQEGFNWAANKTQQFVMTGQSGPITAPSSYNHGYEDTSNVAYIPSYWAGYYNRTAFYARDFAHQAIGAQIVGLDLENISMFKAYAATCTETGGWWTQWALNFDGLTPYVADWWSETNFLHELPAQFELVEKAYQQYLWTGDMEYITSDVLWDMYTHIMVDFVEAHDSNGNGVAEAIDIEGITSSVLMCSYNERSGRPLLEAGDALGAQYQATLAYAAMLAIRGETEASEEWYAKAENLKTYFNEEWSVKEGDEDGYYVHSLGKNGVQYNDFSKETSWFMPMKELLADGERTQEYLDFILESVGDGIGDTAYSPANIEAYTYLPDVFFAYNRADDAWKYMQYILSVKDEPHEIVAQGTNGDYPEVSFTFVSSAIVGMMGVDPNAGDNYVATAACLPSDVNYAKAEFIQVGDHELTLEHDGLTKSAMTNIAAEALTWEAGFYGEYPYISVDGEMMEAEQKTVNGSVISYVAVPVNAGATVSAEAVSDAQLLEQAKTEAKAEVEEYRASKSDADYGADEIAALDAAVEEAAAAIDAAAGYEEIDAAVEAAKAAMDAVNTAKEHAAPVIELIDAIGEVTLESKDAINAAREAYEALSEQAKAAVTNADTLVAAERSYQVLEAEKSAEEAQAAADEAKALADEAKTAADEAAALTAEDKTAAEKSAAAAAEAAVAAEKAQAQADAAASAASAAKTAAENGDDAALAEAVEDAATKAGAAAEELKDTETVAKTAEAYAEAQKAQAAAEKAEAEAAKAKEEAEKAKTEAEEAANKAAEDAAAAEKAAEEAKAAQAAAELANAKFDALVELAAVTSGVDVDGLNVHELENYTNAVAGTMKAVTAAASAEEVEEALAAGKAAIETALKSCPAADYVDVDLERWYHESVDYMLLNGYMNGISDDKFAPDANTTRAMMVTMLYRIAGEPSVEGLENPFTDVPANKWYTDAVIWAANEGVVEGIGSGLFAPDKEITREQIVTILYRYADAEAVAEDVLAGYEDAADVSSWAKDAMNWAVANGLVQGVSATELIPTDLATRAQIAAILMRYLTA